MAKSPNPDSGVKGKAANENGGFGIWRQKVGIRDVAGPSDPIATAVFRTSTWIERP
jgi:hypothetical protein